MGKQKSLLVKFWLIVLFTVALIGLSATISECQETRSFSYDMSSGDTVLTPYFASRNISSPYTLQVIFPDSDSVFSITILSNNSLIDTLPINHNPKFYPFVVYPMSYIVKKTALIYEHNYNTYTPSLYINTTEGDNSVITFILSIHGND